MEIYPKKPIRIASQQELDKEMRRIQQLFKKGESEDTWEAFTLALKNISLWTEKDNANQYEGFVDHFKLLQQSIIKSLTSERTRLSGTATDLLKTVSKAMQHNYEPIHDLFGPTLVRMFARTNKVMYTRALECYRTVIQHAKLPKLIPKLCNALKAKAEPSKSVRECLATCLDQLIHVNDAVDVLVYATAIEAVFKINAMDSAPQVRLAVRNCYKTYCTRFPENASRFEEQLPQDIKKYLNVTTKPSLSKRLSSSSIPKSATTTTKSATTTTKPATATTKFATATKPSARPVSRPKTRYSAPVISKQLPHPQRPSASASLTHKTPVAKPVPSSKPASVSSSKPALVSASVSSRPLSSDPFSLLMRPTASSAQKARPVKKGFILQGMEPFRPIKRSSDGLENKRPTKKPTTERASQ